MIGIVLAGGEGTRCYPTTSVISKQLLPVYDKPMIYYSLALLFEAKIRNILIIATPRGIENYKRLLSDGSQFGVTIRYIIQKEPLGTAHALSLAENYIGNEGCVLIYGDNFIHSRKVQTYIRKNKRMSGASIFIYKVENPTEYGVVELSANGKVISIEEKPKIPKSNYAMIGLMCFDKTICEKIKNIKLSKRSEYEITDVLKAYVKSDQLTAQFLENGALWYDLGDSRRLTEISYMIMKEEMKSGIKIGCLEEIALNNKWISPSDFIDKAQKYQKSQYGGYLQRLIRDKYKEELNNGKD